MAYNNRIVVYGAICIAVPFLLALLHGLIFAFSKRAKPNVSFSIFAGGVSIFALLTYLPFWATLEPKALLFAHRTDLIFLYLSLLAGIKVTYEAIPASPIFPTSFATTFAALLLALTWLLPALETYLALSFLLLGIALVIRLLAAVRGRRILGMRILVAGGSITLGIMIAENIGIIIGILPETSILKNEIGHIIFEVCPFLIPPVAMSAFIARQVAYYSLQAQLTGNITPEPPEVPQGINVEEQTPSNFDESLQTPLRGKSELPLARPISQEHITIGDGKEKVEFAMEHLICVEANQNYVALYLQSDKGTRAVMARAPLKTVEERLRRHGGNILRCHKSYLVNIDFLDGVSGNAQGYKLNARGLNFSVPVSRALQKQVLQKIRNKN